MKTRMKPINIFAEIQRIDEEKRTVDAYAFVREVVDGEGGMRLKRSAMEAATPDYMAWANVRRMHQPDAVGVAQSVEWDNTGARMVVEVVDDDAWAKVKARVYKGLSVGVAPTLVRGKDVETCRWVETSLVDRPKDPDAKILAFRAEGIGEQTEVDVTLTPELIEEAIEVVRGLISGSEGIGADDRSDGISENDALDIFRAMASGDVPVRENLEGAIKGDMHYDCGNSYGCCGHTTRGGAEECQEKRARTTAQAIEWHQSMAEQLAKRRADLDAEIERMIEADPTFLERGLPGKKDDGHDSPPQGYPESKEHYADPANYKYPIDTEEHVRAAWSYIHQKKNQSGYSAEEIEAMENRIRRAGKKFGITFEDNDDDAGKKKRVEDAALLQRFESMTTALTARLDSMEAEIAKASQEHQASDVSEALTRMEARIAVIERQPVAVRPVARFTEAGARPFPTLELNANGEEMTRLAAEFETLKRTLPDEKDEDKRIAGIARLNVIKNQLGSLLT